MLTKATIFDLDGTVLDNEEVYGKAFKDVLEKLGVDVDDEFEHVGGIGVEENWPIFISKYKIKTKKSTPQLALETQDAYLKNLESVQTTEGFEDFAEDLKENGIIVTLATSNTWPIVDKTLRKLNLESIFENITTAEEVKNKKPDPDLFLVAAEKLGIPPADCLVFEDSKAGIEAAKRAGMKVVGIYRDEESLKLIDKADLKITDFNQISPDKLAMI